MKKDSMKCLWRKKIFYDDILISRRKRDKRTVVLDHYLVRCRRICRKKQEP